MEEEDRNSLTSPKKRSSKKIIQVKSAKKNKRKFADDPVPYKKSLKAAFEQSTKTRKCFLCEKDVFAGTYKYHVDHCEATISEDECTITQVVTREEKIGPPIILGDEDHKEKIFNEEPVKKSERNEPRVKKTTPSFVSQTTEEKIVNISTCIQTTDLLLEVTEQTQVETVLENTVENEKYTVKIFNKMLEKVINNEDSQYSCDFWGQYYQQIIDYTNLTSRDKEVFMSLFLRKSQWFSLSELGIKYLQYPNLKAQLIKLVTINFLRDGEKEITTDELLTAVSLDVLKKVARMFKIDPQQAKYKLIPALKESVKSQRRLFTRSSDLLRTTLLKEFGPCYKINDEVILLFKAILTLYSPSETNSILVYDEPKKNIESDLMYGLLKHMKGEVTFPAPEQCNTLDIYRTFAELKEYVVAKELEISIIKAAYSRNYEKVFELSLKIEEILKSADLEYCRSLEPSLRRFTAPNVCIRVLAHIAKSYEKKKDFGEAVQLQLRLLVCEENIGFCCDTRGELWERVAINFETHLRDQESALLYLKQALDDPCVKDKHKVILQDRIIKLTKGRFQPIVIISNPIEKTIKWPVIRKDLGDARKNRWIKRLPDGNLFECSVEEATRQYYLDNEGMTYGTHAEGNIWHTVFGLLFWDIVFSRKHNVWFGETQSCPIDLNYPEFYERRVKDFDQRLSWLETATDDDIKDEINIIWENYNGVINSEIVWEIFDDVDKCLEFITCLPRRALVGIFSRLIGDYRNTRSGFPDLTLWNPALKTVAIVEVKGPGDSLSSKQRLWLHHFTGLGIRAEVCYVQADREHSITI